MENSKDIPALPYIKSLDGIRALAIILVVFFHSPISTFQLQFGWTGVNLFFILSGFLITPILMLILLLCCWREEVRRERFKSKSEPQALCDRRSSIEVRHLSSA